MYDMPMSRQIRHLRLVFLANVFCSTAISGWTGTSDPYTLLAAGGIMCAGFIPFALVQTLYHNHIHSIRILQPLDLKAIARAQKRADKRGESHIEYPVARDTPLLIKRFSVTTRDPETPLYVRELRRGPPRKRSVQWQYHLGGKIQTFRVSKKVLQYHPDMRALDSLIK